MADQYGDYNIVSGSTYAIISSFGGMSDAVIKKRQKLLNKNINQELQDTSEEVLGESLNIMCARPNSDRINSQIKAV